MKLSYTLLFCLAFLLSCTKVEEREKLEMHLSKKKSKLEDTKKEVSTLREEIEDLESQIATIKGVVVKKGKLVTAFEVSSGKFEHYIEVQGNAKSKYNISISTDQGGLVNSIYVEEGQKVVTDEVLVQLDNSILLQNIEEIKTSLELANTVYLKQKNLWDQNIGSEIQYLQAKNNKESLDRKLQTALTQLEKSKINSPINGIVDMVFVKLGEMAAPGSPVIRVVNLDKIEIDASIPESYLGAVKQGDFVDVYFPALDLQKKAKVKSIGQVIDPNNRTFIATVNIDNPDHLLKPNLLSVVKILDYSNNSVISIPAKLVHFGRNNKFVFIVEKQDGDPIAVKREIEIGNSYLGQVEVVSGIEEGDMLIDEGYRDVTHGELLSVASKNHSGSNGSSAESQ